MASAARTKDGHTEATIQREEQKLDLKVHTPNKLSLPVFIVLFVVSCAEQGVLPLQIFFFTPSQLYSCTGC
jgi:hypothetical protein